MKFLRKLFIKDYQDTQNPTVRFRYGLVAGIFGIISNALLCVFKLIVGIIGNSITIIADAINNLSDAGSSVVTLVGFKLSATPPDKDHPFGHGRIEYISGLAVAAFPMAKNTGLAHTFATAADKTVVRRVLAALAARGESTVTGLSHIERGYAEFVPTLRHLGAEITIAEI